MKHKNDSMPPEMDYYEFKKIRPVALPFLRTENNYDRNAASEESALVCADESKTKQSFKEETDINEIVRRFGLTGQLPGDGIRAPTYGDFTEVVDFHTAMNAVAQARESFDKLPAEVRTRFNNDPGAFVDFCSQPENGPELEKMGLKAPKPAAAGPEPTPRAPGSPGGGEPSKPGGEPKGEKVEPEGGKPQTGTT